jgi:hypothetical protein
MKPAIDETDFGYIIIEGSKIEHDVVIRLSGAVKKRKKKLQNGLAPHTFLWTKQYIKTAGT